MAKQLVTTLVSLGLLGLGGSVLWWYTFFSQVKQFLGGPAGLPVECLYTLGGPCGLIENAANAVGATAYEPKLFWASTALLVLGIILGTIGAGDDDAGPPIVRRRKEPRL